MGREGANIECAQRPLPIIERPLYYREGPLPLGVVEVRNGPGLTFFD